MTVLGEYSGKTVYGAGTSRTASLDATLIPTSTVLICFSPSIDLLHVEAAVTSVLPHNPLAINVASPDAGDAFDLLLRTDATNPQPA